MKWSFALVSCLLVLTGCKPSADKAIELAKNEIASNMKDPDSAKFRYMRFIEAGKNNDTIGGFVCGNVNAKNSYGAYAGFSPFYVAIRMKSKGIFSKGVSYTIDDKKIYSEPNQQEMKSYINVCGEDS
ncbi:hypothetical protein RVN05_12725 [Salmonella enterica subsp. enterica serovar Thompson]|jgi:hypothetical protein|uniref:Lipoprotein n=3 Tax=Salmonella enterica TaxID=28901 RepID=A0A5Y4QEW0_SALER|nr:MULTISPECIES: hypothetical protein [Enterobacteriaceae]EAC1071634.1 hypothetical protein [Salmonella enterica subsp. enterica serovar Isangi]EAO8330564.1 hypothetical protein [Salmonella enterica subsp. enterica]EBE7909110.1 hypothetical protein [Salmonella enterica subsp. enterica serovar Putten]EBN5689979.1 hypothetical protein [Salmonella enterica subsp. enterica serovar Uganda]EBU5882274.1 hypothetical protein [Salmonella enterica subsp. enterica serovar Oranienburg]EBV4959728.1 hypoth